MKRPYKAEELDGEPGYPAAAVDLGAAWVHGVAGNPLTALAALTGATLYDTQADMRFLDRDGRPVPEAVDRRMEAEFNALLDLVRGRGELQAERARARDRAARQKDFIQSRPENSKKGGRRGQRPLSLTGEAAIAFNLQQKALEDADPSAALRRGADLSLGEAFQAVLAEKGPGHYTDQELRVLGWHLANVEYSTAARAGDLSLRWWDADDAHEFGGPHCVLKEGYGHLAGALAGRAEDLRLG
eukprot:CAMPEP_0206377282 /NCGR_PEP_ID=MMETSP0294-20121207/10061_1 /ASSEMBLY_ACC=CAM_ASM_000327 /TAXON_ID=39354 /ORGANISM="Heterosigma akashiwo, Strain CCMP2393" /LENGTH=242 /DNA_ID=CAMNT_0053825721 /DNA_START=642 /DNA_END=1366 /DNA_ORIENTATION=-